MDTGTGTDDERALVERARAGDLAAYGLLVRVHQRAAVRLAHVLCGSADDADDVAQDAFVNAHRALDRYRPDRAPFRTWLLAIVANEARNHRRAAGRRHRYELDLAADRSLAGSAAELRPSGGAATASGPVTSSPAVAAERAEDRRLLLAAVAALPERQRDVVACRYLLELSEAETATVLDLAAGTVKSHLSRAMAHLREAVDTDG